MHDISGRYRPEIYLQCLKKTVTARKQKNTGKYSFVNRSITDWNQLPEGAIGTSHNKTHIFKTKVRKVKTSEGK